MALNRDRINALSSLVIGAALEVHKTLGPGLMESAYEVCLCHELSLRGIPHQSQILLPVKYKGIQINADYRIDILVDDCLLLELKSVEKVLPIHKAQTLTYLRLSSLWLGLVINFNVEMLRDGIHRVVNGEPE